MPEWSTNRYILFTLSFIFPDGIGNIIFNYMKEAEFEDARKEHMMDCVLYRAKDKLGSIVDTLCKKNYLCDNAWRPIWDTNYRWYDIYSKTFFETLRHVDHTTKNYDLVQEFLMYVPKHTVMMKYESRYFRLNLVAEHLVPKKKSWTNIGFALKILNNIRNRNWRTYPIETWRERYPVGHYNDYNGNLMYAVKKCYDYIRKEDVRKTLNDYYDWDSGIYKDALKETKMIMKEEQSLKRRFKKNYSYQFKKKKDIKYR